MIALFKARKDPALAKSIASEMVVDGAIDRTAWPLLIAKFWMAVAILASCALIAIFLWIGSATHWSLAIPALAFIGLTYLVSRIWRGLNLGVETVTDMAKAELKKRTANFQMPKVKQNSETSPEI